MKKLATAWKPAATLKTSAKTRQQRAGFSVKPLCTALFIGAMCFGLTACRQKAAQTDAEQTAADTTAMAAPAAETVKTVETETKNATVKPTSNNQKNQLPYLPSADEMKTESRGVFEYFSKSGIEVGFNFGTVNTGTLVFLVSNSNNFSCKVALQFMTEDGKTNTVETIVKPNEQEKEVDPKVNKNYPVAVWTVQAILKN